MEQVNLSGWARALRNFIALRLSEASRLILRDRIYVLNSASQSLEETVGASRRWEIQLIKRRQAAKGMP